MKILILIAFCLTIPNSGKSQLFSRESTRGAALGGILGGIIGHNSGRKTAEGIGIGAGTGWLLGNLARNHRERGAYDTYIPSRRRSVYADSAPAASRPNYAITGAAVGGLAGAIIGHNQGRKTMEGLGIGAASGLLVGGLAEHATRQKESRHYYAHEAPPPIQCQISWERSGCSPDAFAGGGDTATTRSLRATSPAPYRVQKGHHFQYDWKFARSRQPHNTTSPSSDGGNKQLLPQ